MSNATELIAQAERQCQDRRVKLTTKRKLVLKALLSSDKALSAYELVNLCKVEFDQIIPAMSVYRILDFLVGQNLAHKLDLANKYVACGHIDCHVEHELSQFLICSVCQKVSEVTLNERTREGLIDQVQDAGFTLIDPQLEISCVCHDCGEKNA